MAESCVYIPNIGAGFFRSLLKSFGYQNAKKLLYIALDDKFIADYKKSLTLDQEGVPTFDSFLASPYIIELLGEDNVRVAMQKQFNEEEDTIDEYQSLVDQAAKFNNENKLKSKFIAVVESVKNGKIQVRIKNKSKENIEAAKNQQASLSLNRRLSSIFSEIGITVGQLTEIETKSGRVGVTDFSVAKSIASDFSSIVKVANNMEGSKAVSEEFSHLIIGCFRKDVLIDRAINQLSESPEALKAILGQKDFEDNLAFHNNNMKLVAEEALGHLLMDHLLAVNSDRQSSLSKRALNKITQKFQKYNTEDIEKAIIDADTFISKIAKDFLSGSIQIDTETVKHSQRAVQLNALSNKVQRNIDILNKAIQTELKRSKIQKKKYSEKTESLIIELQQHLSDDKLVVDGIYKYIKVAIDSLQSLEKRYASINQMPINERFDLLRATKNYIDSYGEFIEMLSDALAEDKEGTESTQLLADFEINGQKTNISTILKELKQKQSDLKEDFYRKSKKAFTEFIEPFLGKNAVVTRGENKGKKITAETLMEASDYDISLYDTWLNSMTDSADVLLQVFGTVVYRAKDEARKNTLSDISHIQALFLDAQKSGVTDFEFMFEKFDDGSKTGNYIGPVNKRQYFRDKKAFEEELDKEFGKNPTGEKAQKRFEKFNVWHEKHSSPEFRVGIYNPNAVLYKNNEFENLSAAQKEFYNRFMDLKSNFDSKLPPSRVYDSMKAIQQRKDSTQRLTDSLKKGGNLFEELKNHMEAEFGVREDDSELYGDRDSNDLVDFSNREYMRLPVLYTDRIKNPDELSTDLFRSLQSYALMANTYEQMDSVVDPLEIGRMLVEDKIAVKKSDNGKIIREKLSGFGVSSVTEVFKKNNNRVLKLEQFMKSQVYGRYLEDQGCYHFLGKAVDKQKFWGKVVEYSSLAQLGFNWIADTVNALNGVHMQNIEAAAGQFFGVSELASADKDYTIELKDMFKELGLNVKTNKLDLFDQLFDIKQDFKRKVSYKNMSAKLFKKLFGESMAYLGQECGDHWLYNRTAIAMAKRKKVLLEGKETFLWDALKVENAIKDRDDVKQLNYKQIKEVDGSDFDVSAFSRQVAKVNQKLFGIYNEDDLIAAKRYCEGKVLMLFRGWLFPALNRRFRKATYNNITDSIDEGYYVTSCRILKELMRGEKQLSMLFEQMTDEEKMAVKKTITEFFQTLIVWGLANWVEWPDDKNRPWALKYLELISRKDAHDLATLTPSLAMLDEAQKTLKSPTATLGPIGDCIWFLRCLTSPEAWTKEKQSGPYKGWTDMEKAIYLLPVPVLNHIRRYDKIFENIDYTIDWYIRPTR